MAPRPHILTKRIVAKRLVHIRIAVGVAAATFAWAASATATTTQARTPAWTLKQVTQYLPGTNHSQYGVVVVERGQAWFLGGSNVPGGGVPEAAFRKNGTWVNPGLPSGLHSWIIAASGTSASDVWAVTYLAGSVLHWNGSRWTVVPNGGWSTFDQLTGITATSPTNVWLFGAGGSQHSGAGTWHLSGATWTQVTGVASHIRRASAAGPDDIWAIGGIGGPMNALVHFDGSTWRRVRPTALTGFRYSHVLTLSRRNVWVAGSVAGTPRLGHFNGSGWKTVAMPASATVAATGMCRDGAGGLWVIANAGTSPSVVFHRSATGTWSRRAQVSGNRTNEVLACASVPGRHAAWGAGKAAPPPRASGTAAAVYGTGDVP